MGNIIKVKVNTPAKAKPVETEKPVKAEKVSESQPNSILADRAKKWKKTGLILFIIFLVLFVADIAALGYFTWFLKSKERLEWQILYDYSTAIVTPFLTTLACWLFGLFIMLNGKKMATWSKQTDLAKILKVKTVGLVLLIIGAIIFIAVNFVFMFWKGIWDEKIYPYIGAGVLLVGFLLAIIGGIFAFKGLAAKEAMINLGIELPKKVKEVKQPAIQAAPAKEEKVEAPAKEEVAQPQPAVQPQPVAQPQPQPQVVVQPQPQPQVIVQPQPQVQYVQPQVVQPQVQYVQPQQVVVKKIIKKKAAPVQPEVVEEVIEEVVQPQVVETQPQVVEEVIEEVVEQPVVKKPVKRVVVRKVVRKAATSKVSTRTVKKATTAKATSKKISLGKKGTKSVIKGVKTNKSGNIVITIGKE